MAEHSCGHPQHVCSDKSRQWFPQLEVCYPTMEQDAARERFRRLHEKRPWHDGTFTSWGEEQSADHPYRFDYGVTIWASREDLGHGGDFLSGRPSEQAGGDDAEAEDGED